VGEPHVAAEGGKPQPVTDQPGVMDSTCQLRKGGSIVRVRVADGHVEPVTSLERVPLVAAEGSWNWIGIAPDDSPLALREMTGPVEIYAFDVEWP
jgi:hypothetical protein